MTDLLVHHEEEFADGFEQEPKQMPLGEVFDNCEPAPVGKKIGRTALLTINQEPSPSRSSRSADLLITRPAGRGTQEETLFVLRETHEIVRAEGEIPLIVEAGLRLVPNPRLLR